MSDKNIIDFENEKVEYEVKLSSDKDSIKKWAKTLVGFANTYGGTLCVGVNDNGKKLVLI